MFGEVSDAIGKSVTLQQVQLGFTVLARLFKHLLDLVIIATRVDVSVLLIRIGLLLLLRMFGV